MRATCGVMSARRPIILPESWSTTLKVRSSRSCPVPVSSESMYSSNGGIQLVFVLDEKVQDRTAQALDPHRFGGKDVLHVFRQPPAHQELTRKFSSSPRAAAAGRPASTTGRRSGSARRSSA